MAAASGVAQKFAGKWKSNKLENWTDYMKALEVSFVKRKTGEYSTTYIEITVNGDAWRWKYQIAHKKGDLSFKLGEEFDEVTADDRKVKSMVTMEGDTLVWLQTGKPCNTTLRRTIEEDGKVMVEMCEAKGVICKRTYLRTE